MSPDLATDAVTASVLVGALVYLARTGRRFLRRVVNATDVILGNDDHAPLDKRLAWIEGQLKPNGGESLRDAVNRIEKASK